MPTHDLTILCRCGASLPIPPNQHLALSCPACGQCYPWKDGILILGEEAHQMDYPESVYDVLANIEARHFWFSGRNAIILSMIRRVLGNPAGHTVLDVGCGTGFVLSAVEQTGMHVCGLDMHLAGLRYARRRVTGPLICETTTRLPFRTQFDLVLLCDVIEHNIDDSAVIREVSTTLKPNGYMIITVPADPKLWTNLDSASGHKRRYTQNMLRQALLAGGLRPVVVKPFNYLLYPVVRLQRLLLERRVTTDDTDTIRLFKQAFQPPPLPINMLCEALMKAEAALGGISMPFGASLIAVGQRVDVASRNGSD